MTHSHSLPLPAIFGEAEAHNVTPSRELAETATAEMMTASDNFTSWNDKSDMIISNPNQPESVTPHIIFIQQIFQIIHELTCSGGLSPIVAGGAVRNLFLDKPIRDVDVYTHPMSSIENLDMVVNASNIAPHIRSAATKCGIKNYQVEYDDTGKKPEYEASEVNPIRQIVCVNVTIDGIVYPVEIMVMSFEVNFFKYIRDFFAVNISKVWIHDGDIRFYPQFVRDLKENTITVDAEMTGRNIPRVFGYYVNKLSKLLPHHTIAINPNILDTIDFD